MPFSAVASRLGLSLFCQWTITKVIITLEGVENASSDKCKVVVEIEDLLASIDEQDAYTKYTSKVGHFNLDYYEQKDKEDWKEREYLRIQVLTENSSMPFINVIMTSVALRDYYRRLGIKRSSDPLRSITELIVDMMAVEIIADVAKVAEFITPLFCMLDSTENTEPKANQTPSKPLNVQNMPMVHLNSKGLTLYVPLESGRDCCSVLIWKVASVKVTPNLENSLQRTPVRPDVFYKAAQMGILGVPGSSVEDRQYELTLRNISAATGNWNQILSHLRKQATNFYRTNPAFEWNNQNRRTQLQLNDMFSNFTFSTIFAPCVIYNSILICGQAVEMNCNTDFVATINIYQLKLLCCLIQQLQNITQ